MLEIVWHGNLNLKHYLTVSLAGDDPSTSPPPHQGPQAANMTPDFPISRNPVQGHSEMDTKAIVTFIFC